MKIIQDVTYPPSSKIELITSTAILFSTLAKLSQKAIKRLGDKL
jgi:hypothetical protein